MKKLLAACRKAVNAAGTLAALVIPCTVWKVE
jgi:hypothetical protein